MRFLVVCDLVLDYISPRLTQMMIENGPQACFMKDKKGYLPAHVACSRHCSPEKLRMLLNVNPKSLYSTTNDGKTLLSLAQSTATKSHPNFALIEELHQQLQGKTPHVNWPAPSTPSRTVSHYPHFHDFHHAVSSSDPSDTSSRGRLDSNDSNKTWQEMTYSGTSEPPYLPTPRSGGAGPPSASGQAAMTMAPPRKKKNRKSSKTGRKRKSSSSSLADAGFIPFPSGIDDPADLLLHFSRNNTSPRANANSYNAAGHQEQHQPESTGGALHFHNHDDHYATTSNYAEV